MPNYRVAVDSLTGKHGRIHYRGDTVTDEQFISAEELAKQGFLEKFIVIEEKIELKPEPKLEDFTRGTLMDRLKEAGVKFSPNSSKVELFEIWKKL